MKNTTAPRLGPVVMGTLVTNQGEDAVSCYTNYLYQRVAEQGTVDETLASFWGADAMVGAKYWILENQMGKRWLRIIEDSSVQPATPLRHTGWISLEVSVADVDELGRKLLDSPFKIIGVPANLDVSDKIRAMQVVGPANEVLYLTEVKEVVPPFELPQAECPVDSLFIPVMSCHNRDDCLGFYEAISENSGVNFDTKITVINRAFGYEVLDRHPVATIQLSNNTLIEIDQIAEATTKPQTAGHLPAGIAMITFMVESLDAIKTRLSVTPAFLQGSPYQGKAAVCLRGSAGELIELIEEK